MLVVIIIASDRAFAQLFSVYLVSMLSGSNNNLQL